MVNGIFKKEMLENLLQRQWTDYLDHVRMMRMVMEDVRDNSFKEIVQEQIPLKNPSITLTKVIYDNPLELWIEFTIPKLDGIVIGTNTYLLNLLGEIVLKESFGTHFRPQTTSKVLINLP